MPAAVVSAGPAQREPRPRPRPSTAVALAISGCGALSSFETTVLLTVDETIDALRRAEQVRYEASGA